MQMMNLNAKVIFPQNISDNDAWDSDFSPWNIFAGL